MSWTLFPIYGLTITEPDAWLDDPIFKDATIVSLEALENYLKRRLGDQYTPVLAHGKLSEAVDVSSIGLPTSQLLELRPSSYIAVRDRQDGKQRRRAVEIRALLSCTMALRGLRLKTIADDPAHVAWFIAPREAMVHPTNPPSANIAPSFNEHVLLERLEASQADMRQSFRTGSLIPNNRGWEWDIYEKHPVCHLFLSDINKFQKRLLNAALQIQEAGCAQPYESQIQMAVAGFEVMLKPASFQELRSMIESFFPGEDQGKRVGALLSTRHRITHEGGAADDREKVKAVARDGLMLAWTMLDIATAYDKMGLTTPFDDYIRMQVDAMDLDERLSRLGVPTPYKKTLYERIPGFHKHMTTKVNFPDEPSK
jgi:hypothetical protein